MKYTLSLLLVIGLCTFSFSQDSKFEIGIQGGNTISTIRQTGYTQYPYNYKPSYTASIFMQYNLNKYFSLRIEPGFENKGYDSKYDSILYDNGSISTIINGYPTTTNLNYITLPMLARFSVGKKVKYFLNAGPYLGFLISQNTTYNIPIYPSTTNSIAKKNMNDFKPMDLGISTGLGMTIPMKNIFALSLEIRNNYGLTDISKTKARSTNNNLSFNILVGLSYKIGAKIKTKTPEIIYLN